MALQECLGRFKSIKRGSKAHLDLTFSFHHRIFAGVEHHIKLTATLYNAQGEESWTVPWLGSRSYLSRPDFGMCREYLDEARAELLPASSKLPQSDFLDLIYCMVGIGACYEFDMTSSQTWSLEKENEYLL